MKDIDSLVISDLHLGSPLCKINKLKRVLNSYNYKRLIIVGDGFDGNNCDRLRHSHFGILNSLNKLTSPKKHVEVIWIKGNHDEHFLSILEILGVRTYKEYFFEVCGKKYYAVHGHQFDLYLNKYQFLSKVIIYLFNIIKHTLKEKYSICSKITSLFNKVINNSFTVSIECVNHLKKIRDNYQDYIILFGHTHEYKDSVINDVRIVNTGHWTGDECSYVIINEDGTLELKTV